MDQINNFRAERQRLNDRILSPENKAGIMKRVYATDHYAYLQRNEGLATIHKEMLGLVSSMVLRCDDCIKYHLEKCYELGVANDEMMDLFGIANVVGGTIVIPHTRRAIEYWELLLANQPLPNPFDPDTKKQNYEAALQSLEAMLQGVNNHISIMATINEVLKSHIPYFYWVGFYLLDGAQLTVGPYQGTHGCLYIPLGQGVCGRAALEQKTIIVPDIEALNNAQTGIKGQLHITCDVRCKSEIVVPVFDSSSQLIGVFDVDSTHKQSFDDIDQHYLELMMRRFFWQT